MLFATKRADFTSFFIPKLLLDVASVTFYLTSIPKAPSLSPFHHPTSSACSPHFPSYFSNTLQISQLSIMPGALRALHLPTPSPPPSFPSIILVDICTLRSIPDSPQYARYAITISYLPCHQFPVLPFAAKLSNYLCSFFPTSLHFHHLLSFFLGDKSSRVLTFFNLHWVDQHS